MTKPIGILFEEEMMNLCLHAFFSFFLSPLADARYTPMLVDIYVLLCFCLDSNALFVSV